MSTAITKAGGGFALSPSNWNELMQFAELAAKSDLVPKDYRGKPANVAIAVQWGGELGLAPLQALQGIAVINGRPGLWGDVMLALCMVHPDYVDTEETWDEKTLTATCIAKRKGRSDKVWTFGTEDVKKANLGATHNSYPRRMRQMRARGFALRDQWTDVLKGMISAEEAQDYPKPEVRAEVVDQQPPNEPQQLPPPADADPPKTAAKSKTPRFSISWKHDGGKWADKPLASAPPEVLGVYITQLAEALKKLDETSEAAQKTRGYLEKAEAAMRALMEAETPAAEPDAIAAGLQKQHDGPNPGMEDDSNPAWGLEAPQ